MDYKQILNECRAGRRLSREELYALYGDAPTAMLMEAADTLRRGKVDDPSVVTWQIDRNVNITNVCISGCKFCNFHCKPHQTQGAYITSMQEYVNKTEHMLALGGDQLLIQGGLHPKLGVEFYEELFRELKRRFPTVRLNALGAPEVTHIARLSRLTIAQTLQRLHEAGLDTLPGAGAEILSDRVRHAISPAKPSVKEWCEVMREAHRQNIPSTATMMYGHIETMQERIDHLLLLRSIQDEVPEQHYGFTAFIPWVFCSRGTQLEHEGIISRFSPTEYLRLIAIARLTLDNFRNIQASWLTVGKATAQVALHAGANDFGSIMIEEHVVASAGASNRFDAESIKAAISEAGFTPRLRDQLYRFRD